MRYADLSHITTCVLHTIINNIIAHTIIMCMYVYKTYKISRSSTFCCDIIHMVTHDDT